MNSAHHGTTQQCPSRNISIGRGRGGGRQLRHGDAHAVFSALRTSFVSDRAADDVPEEMAGPGSTVWTSTFDVTDLRAAAEPRPLTAPVTVTLQGGYWAVARLREGLAVRSRCRWSALSPATRSRRSSCGWSTAQ